LAAALLICLASACHSSPPPASVSTLVKRAAGKGLTLRVVPLAKNGPVNDGAYLMLADDQRAWEELIELSAHPARLNAWRGVVLCVPNQEYCSIEGQHIGNVVLYGDLELIQRIREAASH
jgi:hypothetical protein